MGLTTSLAEGDVSADEGSSSEDEATSIARCLFAVDPSLAEGERP